MNRKECLSSQARHTDVAHLSGITKLCGLMTSMAHEMQESLAAIVCYGAASQNWLSGESPDLERAKSNIASIMADAKRAAEILRHLSESVTRAVSQSDRVGINELVRDVTPQTVRIVPASHFDKEKTR